MFCLSRQCDFNLLRASSSFLGTYAHFVFALAILLAGLGGRTVFAQTEIDIRQEYNVKAVYLYSFGRYVVWPTNLLSGDEPFTIGLLGGDPFAGALDRIAKKKQIGGKRIVILRFESAADYQPCHILFLSKSVPEKEQSAVISEVDKQPVLLVADIPGFAIRGGTTNFFLSDGTVRFEINVDAVKRQGLSIDAKLLSLAKLVKGT